MYLSIAVRQRQSVKGYWPLLWYASKRVGTRQAEQSTARKASQEDCESDNDKQRPDKEPDISGLNLHIRQSKLRARLVV